MLLLHTNDFHGHLTAEKAEALRLMRLEADLWVDSGDAIRAGNLAIPVRRDPVWRHLADAGCDVGTLGNRESHVLESAFRRKISGARHTLLCANLVDKQGRPVLAGTTTRQFGGLLVGFVGVMVPMVTEGMASKAASAYLWTPPIPTAADLGKKLRPEVDCLIAVTHIGYSQDRALAEAWDGFDLILGGHSHTVLEQPERVGTTWICQGGSHGRFVGRYRWEPSAGLIDAELVPLPDVKARRNAGGPS